MVNLFLTHFSLLPSLIIIIAEIADIEESLPVTPIACGLFQIEV